MLKIIICFLVILEMLSTFAISFKIADKADNNRNKNITTALINYIRELFVGRNWFGIVLSSVVFIIGIPAFLLIILAQIIVSMVRLLITMWKWGNKK